MKMRIFADFSQFTSSSSKIALQVSRKIAPRDMTFNSAGKQSRIMPPMQK
jgi:hypothetical protein